MQCTAGVPTGGRRGISLVEVLISVAVLGLAMAPIVGIAHRSFSQIRTEKDEATAANVAGQILNQVLFEAKYDEVLANSYTSPGPPPQQILSTGAMTMTVDGTEVEWKTTITPMDSLQFIYRQFTYHPGESGGETNSIAGFSFPTFKRVSSLDTQGADDRQFNNAAQKIDKKFVGTRPAVMVEVHLELRWRPPGGTYTPYENLYVRRAKLD